MTTVSTLEMVTPRSVQDADLAALNDLAFWRLPVTVAPWRITDGEKILAMSGGVDQYRPGRYNGPHAGCKHGEWCPERAWRKDWQPGFILSPRSRRIAIDFDDVPRMEALLDSIGIELPLTVKVLTRKGFHLHFDGRRLTKEQWPLQGHIYDADGAMVGDLKSNGFTPMPGTRHPSVFVYSIAPDSGRTEASWDPAWGELLASTRTNAKNRSNAGAISSYDNGAARTLASGPPWTSWT
jgi:hypothetical protein